MIGGIVAIVNVPGVSPGQMKLTGEVLADIFRGVLPFWAMMVLCVAILIAWPQIALFLPNTMFN